MTQRLAENDQTLRDQISQLKHDVISLEARKSNTDLQLITKRRMLRSLQTQLGRDQARPTNGS